VRPPRRFEEEVIDPDCAARGLHNHGSRVARAGLLRRQREHDDGGHQDFHVRSVRL
jgi:hypothetical protein